MQANLPRRLQVIALIIFVVVATGCGAQTAPPATPAVIAQRRSPPPAPTLLPSVTPIPPVAASATIAPTIASTATIAPTLPPTSTAIPAPLPIDPVLAGKLQATLDELVADGFIPGAVLAVNIPGYATWTGASGYIDRSKTQPITPDTRMRIASISKTFTAAVVLQLVDEGRLSLDAPLATWYPTLVPRSDEITVRRLLNHTTGLHDYLEDGEFLGQAYSAPDYRWLPAELATYAGQKGFLFVPGTPNAWDYSSTNYVILGMIVEAVTGNSLAQEMRTRIFEPLNLHNTYFVPDDEVTGAYARGHRHGSDVHNISLSFAYATANMVSTVADVQLFADALFDGRLLSPASMDAMLSFLDGKGQYNMPALEYGLGVMRNRLPVGLGPDGTLRPADLATVVGHTGGFGGFRSVLWYAPATGVTITLGENQGATDPNILATAVLDAVLDWQGR